MEITFINSFVSTRSGFRHETLLFVGNDMVRKSKLTYLNRTWESYRFQSVMKHACDEEIAFEIERLKAEYKEQTGKKRVSKTMVFTNEKIEALTKKRSEL